MRLPCEPQYILRSKALNGHSKALNGTFIGYEKEFYSIRARFLSV